MFEYPRLAKVSWKWTTLWPGDCIFIPAGIFPMNINTILLLLELCQTQEELTGRVLGFGSAGGFKRAHLRVQYLRIYVICNGKFNKSEVKI